MCVNAFVPDDRLDCLHFTLVYPTIDHLVTQMSEIGPQAQLYKIDLQRNYIGIWEFEERSFRLSSFMDKIGW